ncbi:MAG: helix-turn-helix domain-containing protein [Bacteriovoracaceae bacterium]|nr:helix-turn-helix domain-containing protein [Bacteriovoracaceae bacterium]
MTNILNADYSAMLFNNRIWDEWLSTKEAARFLSTTPNAIRIMVCRGKIGASKLGRRLRFKLSDLRDLLLKKGDQND